MRLLIKQRVFSWSDTYDVYDEEGNAKYFIKNEIFSFFHRIHVMDANGKENGLIKQEFAFFLPRFEIEIGGRPYGSIEKEFSCATQDTNWTTTDGDARGIFWRGIMMCMRAAAR